MHKESKSREALESLMPIQCAEVLRQISDYLDGEVGLPMRKSMDLHFKGCKPCTAVLDGIRNLLGLANDRRVIPVPAGFSRRLHSRLAAQMEEPADDTRPGEIPLGITDDYAPLGSHLIYFWESEADFERGVHFVESGLRRGDHCVLFGHDEALQRAQRVLYSNGFAPDALMRSRDLTVIRRHTSVEGTLSEIESAVGAAIQVGATTVRFLGNLGLGRVPLPAGEDDVIQLEERVSAVVSRFPCVVVCMYDVRTLPGRLIVRGGLQTHQLAICGEGLRENPYYIPPQDSSQHIHRVH